MNMNNQRGSAMLETVIFLALVSFLFMMVVGQLVFMTRVSRREDARVQGFMAARIKVEELRAGWPEAVFLDEYQGSFPLEDMFEDFNMLGHGEFRLEKEADDLYKVVIRIYDNKGLEAYSTQTTVWVEP